MYITILCFNQAFNFRYRVFEIDDPYVRYGIKIAVQQLEMHFNTTTQKKEEIWKPIGQTIIGPRLRGNIVKDKKKDSPEVCIYNIQWNLQKEAMLGQGVWSFIERCPFYVQVYRNSYSPPSECPLSEVPLYTKCRVYTLMTISTLIIIYSFSVIYAEIFCCWSFALVLCFR